MTANTNCMVVARKALLCCDLNEGAIILDLETGIYYGLDNVGAFIWSLIQEPKTFSDITAAVLDEYSVEADRCAKDLRNLFSEMVQRNLVEVHDAQLA